jgi:hypothetical protein
MARDDFSATVKDVLAKRVALCCSNPKCNVATSGPHTETFRSVNLGVASHITAAAPGGPRFDESLTPEERASIDNGIWLCQCCAKLVDSDLTHYSVPLLKNWKVTAEARALRALGGDIDHEFFPQAASAVHTPIPKIYGLPYDEARELLVEAGWQPRSRHWSHGSDPNVRAGNGLYFWQKGYWELINAWPTGLAQCDFGFHDVYGNLLTVTTLGEIIEDLGATAYVYNWYFMTEA